MALIDATEDDWKGDARLIGNRNSLPFQPSALEEKADNHTQEKNS